MMRYFLLRTVAVFSVAFVFLLGLECVRGEGGDRLNGVDVETADVALKGRERDRFQVPEGLELVEANRVIEAIRGYRRVLESGDLREFYAIGAHQLLKDKVSAEKFVKGMTEVSEALLVFFDDVIAAYSAKGHCDPDFQIGGMPHPILEGVVIVQFADRIDLKPQIHWPKAKPVRIQLALDGGVLRFYDID